jgi:hypothetical protein
VKASKGGVGGIIRHDQRQEGVEESGQCADRPGSHAAADEVEARRCDGVEKYRHGFEGLQVRAEHSFGGGQNCKEAWRLDVEGMDIRQGAPQPEMRDLEEESVTRPFDIAKGNANEKGQCRQRAEDREDLSGAQKAPAFDNIRGKLDG